MKKPLKAIEREYMGLVKQLPCCTCGAHPPSSAHHPRVEQGLSQRAGHFMVVPHCNECHVGDFSIHKTPKQFNAVYGPEMDRINSTIGKVFKELTI